MPTRNAAALDQSIDILRAATEPNAFNEPIATWHVLIEVPAGVTDVSAGESYRAQQVGAELGTRFLIRWSPAVASVDPRDRVRFAGRTYNITAVRNFGRQRWREIDAVMRADTAEASP